jgi:hypothetical protein
LETLGGIEPGIWQASSDEFWVVVKSVCIGVHLWLAFGCETGSADFVGDSGVRVDRGGDGFGLASGKGAGVSGEEVE